MRKDPLDPIDGGTKVKLAMRRVFRPAEAKVSRLYGALHWGQPCDATAVASRGCQLSLVMLTDPSLGHYGAPMQPTGLEHHALVGLACLRCRQIHD